MRVLIAVASKYGSTKGIAEFVGERLRAHGLQVDVREADQGVSAGGYDAFVVGSALYMGEWLKEAKQFVSKNSKALLGHPVWLFSSGPVGTKLVDSKGRDLRETSGPKELDQLLALARPRDHRVFFGAFYGARLTGTTAFFFKLALKSQSAREAMPEGDFRDWKEIENWANEISEVLKSPKAEAPGIPAGGPT